MSETLDELDQVEVGDELNEIAGRVQKLLQETEQLVPVRVGQFFYFIRFTFGQPFLENLTFEIVVASILAPREKS